MTRALHGIVWVPVFVCTLTFPNEPSDNDIFVSFFSYRMCILAFLTALRSAGAKVAPLPTTLSALPGLEVGDVQRIPRRLKLALARLELRTVILVSTSS